MRSRLRRAQHLLGLSVAALRSQRTRTTLAMSGMAAAVATVVVVSAVNAGAEERVLQRVQAMGSNMLAVSAAPAPRIAGRSRQVSTVTLLRPADATAVAAESPRAVAAAAVVNRSMLARAGDRTTSVPVSGTTVDGLRIRRLRAAPGRGRVFDDAEASELRRVALVGPTAARALFGDDDPVGAVVRLGRVPFEIVGVLAARGTDVTGSDLDHVIVVPLETAMRRLLNVAYVDQVVVQARSSDDLDALESEVRAVLDRRHPVRSGITDPWVVQNQGTLLRTERGARLALRRAALLITTVALLVGAYGVAALMYTAVRDRAHEIGVRRAVGARRRDIVAQFLAESTVVGMAGGVGGIVLGVATAAAVAALGPWDLMLRWQAVASAIAASGLLGIAAGAVPAARASRLEPADAIRSS